MIDPVPIDEPAKAVQEASKTASKLIDAGTSFGAFLNRIFGAALEDTVGYLWGDRIRLKCVERAVYDVERLESLAEKTRDRLGKSRLLRQLSPSVALPLIEAATVEYDEELHSLWANLLAFALEAGREPIGRQFVTILSDLSREDVLALRNFIEVVRAKLARMKLTQSNPQVIDFSPADFSDRTIANLVRLGIVTASIVSFENYIPGGVSRHGEYGPSRETFEVPTGLDSLTFTGFGVEFCRSVGLWSEDAELRD